MDIMHPYVLVYNILPEPADLVFLSFKVEGFLKWVLVKLIWLNCPFVDLI